MPLCPLPVVPCQLLLVLEPDPRKNRKEGLGNRLGWKCTMRPECRHASDWFMIACLCVFIGNTNRNPLVQFNETENKQDLLAREVVGAQSSSYRAHGQLEVPEIKWVRANNYKFHTFCSVHFHLSLPPRPSFRFSEGLVLRLISSLVMMAFFMAQELSDSTTIAIAINRDRTVVIAIVPQ